MYSDTFFANCTSLIRYKCALLFVTDFGYLKFTAMKNKSEAGYALQELIRYIGICEHTRILRALVKHPQGNLEEIQQKTLQSTQEEPGGRQDCKA